MKPQRICDSLTWQLYFQPSITRKIVCPKAECIMTFMTVTYLCIKKFVVLEGSNKLSNLKENNDITALDCLMFLFNIITN